MRKSETISTEELRTALDDADEARAAKRLVVALAYKDSVHVETPVERYGIPQSAIYCWLDRLENQPLADALQEETRPGRSPKVSTERRVEVETWLDTSPRAFGYLVEKWSADTVGRNHVKIFATRGGEILERLGVDSMNPYTTRFLISSTSVTPSRTSTGCF